MSRLARALIVTAIVALAPSFLTATTLPPGFVESVVFSGLTNPTNVQFAADGRVFVAEKSGVIEVFASLSATTPTVFADLSASVMNYWDRGLLGLALHPNFPATPYVYVLYTLDAPIGGTPPVWNDACPTPPGPTTNGCVVGGRLSRLQASGSAMVPGSEQVLIENWCQQFPSHSIGDLAFGADGALYVSAGEGGNFLQVDYGQTGNPCGDPPAGAGGAMAPPAALGGALRAQDLAPPGFPVPYGGKILRVDPLTGAALPDNPLAGSGSGADRVIAEGFRNPYRFTVRPGTSELWIGDVGWNDWEEIDRVADPKAGVGDFGWPCYEGPAQQPSYAATGLTACQNLYAAGTAVGPYFAYNHADQVVPGESCASGSSSISGLAFYGAGSYPSAYSGALFFSDYSRDCIWAMFPNGTGLPDPSTRITFGAGAAAPVDLQIGPGGDLYYVDFNGGTVRRVQYTGPAEPPTARATADQQTGPAPLTVHFDASGATDPNPGATLAYSWDLNGDGQYGDSTSVAPSYTYAATGVYTVGLRVTDSLGLTATTSLTITVDAAPPVVTISAPSPSTTWSVGDVIAFAGSAVDPKDGPLPPAALSWSIILHHCPSTCHMHLVETVAGVAGGSVAAPDHDYPSYLEIRLTATDSLGLTGSASVNLQPNTVDLTIASAPPGIAVALGSDTEAAPFTRTVIVGSGNSLAAATPQALAGVPYDFVSWSDGGAAAHDVTAAGTPATYTVTFARGCPGTCGDGVVQPGCEQCDLGASNCQPGQLCDSGCTAGCRVIGRCTGTGTPCATVGDCPAGEGCCGNGVVEGPAEACDDGNLLDGDCCSHLCQPEPAGACEPPTCASLGPHLRAASAVRAAFLDRLGDGTSERWSTRGDFSIDVGEAFDPAVQGIDLAFSQGGRVLYDGALAPGAFVENRDTCTRRWRFLDRTASQPSAPGWRSGKLTQARLRGGSPGMCGPQLSFAFGSGTNGTVLTPAAGLVRQTMRAGDDCVTALMTCASAAGGRLTCR